MKTKYILIIIVLALTSSIFFFLLSGIDTKEKNSAIALTNSLNEAQLIKIKGEGSENLKFTKDGQAILLSFWASWCIECLKELATLNQMAKSTEGKVKVIGIATLEKQDAAIGSLFFNRADFSLFFDEGSRLAEIYKVESLPQSFLFDADGNFLRYFKGQLENKDVLAINELITPAQ